jgi:two-component system, OmpR family, manganese sensing sensor histidine kinase
MGLAIGLSPINNNAVRRMVAANLLVVIVVISVFASGVYFFSSARMFADERQRLTLFNGSLVSSIDPGENEPDLLSATRSEPTTIPLSHMNVQWYSVDGRLLMELGALKVVCPFIRDSGFVTQKEPNALLLTTPAVVRKKLFGYIRTGESLDACKREVQHLIGGLSVGILLSLLVSAIGILWLTKISLAPVEEAYLKLRRFTDDASHELRSPLMAVKSNLELVLRRAENLEPVYQSSLVTAQNAVDQMTQLTNGLLLLAMAEKTQQRPEGIAIDLRELLKEVVSEHQLQAVEKKIRISCEFANGVMVFGVPEQLKSVFGNLLANALAYTPENGAVEISLALTGTNALVRVSDNGIGISAADLPKIFDRFWRADRARHYSASGAGLGLSIAHTFVQQLGGAIKVQSKIGGGTTFVVTLPVASMARKD